MFGVHEYALRLPSVLISTAAVFVTFYIGTILLSSGRRPAGGDFPDVQRISRGSDIRAPRERSRGHPADFSFRARHSACPQREPAQFRGRWHRPGAACGFAYLTKSFPALLMLPVWAVMRHTVPLASLARELGIAGVVAAVIAAPWAIYSASAFPLESSHERAEALRRITEVLESQGGPAWRYLAEMPRHFGELIYLPIAIAIYLVLRRGTSSERRALLLWAAIPYVVFSACATKAPGYVMIAAPAIFLVQADVWLWLSRRAAGCLPARQPHPFDGRRDCTGRAAGAISPGAGWSARAARSAIHNGLSICVSCRNTLVLKTPSYSMSRETSTPCFYHHTSCTRICRARRKGRSLQQRGFKTYVVSNGSDPLPDLPPDVIVIRPEYDFTHANQVAVSAEHRRHRPRGIALAGGDAGRRDRIQHGYIARIERDVGRTGIFFHTRSALRSRYGDDVVTFGQQPAQCKLCRCAVLLARKLLQFPDQRDVALEVARLETWVRAANVVFGHVGHRLEAARQESTAQRTEPERSRCRARGRRPSTPLFSTSRVRSQHRLRSAAMKFIAAALRRVAGAASDIPEMPHFPRANEFCHRADRFLYGDVQVDTVRW